MTIQRAVWVLAVVIIAVGARGAAPPDSTLQQAVKQAVNRGDDAALMQSLESLATADVRGAMEFSFRILTSGAPHQRPVAVAAMMKHASAAELAAVATRLAPASFHDERRLLVRAIGLSKDKNVLSVLAPFVRDQDMLVRAAAASAVADSKDPSAAALLLKSPPSLVDYTQIGGDGEDHLCAKNTIGALRALSGLNPENTNGFLHWWREGGKPVSQPDDTPWHTSAKRPFAVRSFDIRFKPDRAREILAQRLVFRADSDWARFFKTLEQEVEQDRQVAGKIFGPVYPPYCRIDFATHQTIAASGGISEGYGGFASDGLITIDAETFLPGAWEGLIRHEYIHELHGSQFLNQPRWLSEGLAVSLSESPYRTSWTSQRVVSSGLANAIRQGGVSTDIKWINGASAGSNEALQYALGGLVVDYLRFGGISAAEQRLYCLMGELSRGAAPTRAFESVYGVPLRQLDADLAKWIATLKPESDSTLPR